MNLDEPIIVVRNGKVFEGNMEEFQEKFFKFAPDLTLDDKLIIIKEWATQHGWSFNSYWRN